MKNILWILVVAVSVFAMACDNDNNPKNEMPPAGYLAYTSDSLGIDLVFPNTFVPVPYINEKVPISFFEASADSVSYLLRPNMSFNFQEIPPVEISLTEYLNASKTGLELEMKNVNPGFKTLGVDSFKSGEQNIGFFTYETPKNADSSFTSKMYVIIRPGHAVLVNCTTLTPLFAQYESIYDDFVKSITFKKK